MKPGFSVGGHYEIEGTTSPSSQLSVLLQRVPGEGSSGSYRNAGPGRFILKGVHPGRYVIRAYVPTGWYLKSATHAGQDVADEPFEISSDITDLVVTIANRAAQVTGVITRSDGTPAPEAAVVLFPVEQARRIWSRAPRLLQQVRPGPDGQYVIRGLPAGEYFLATVRESQMDAWPDPKFLDSLARTAVRLLLADGEARSVPLTLGAGR